MKTAGAIPAFVRAGALLVAALLFVIAIFSDSAWQELVGIGLALVAIALALGFGRPGHAQSRTQGLVKAVAHGGAALFFIIGAFSDTSLTEMFALGFVLLTLAVAFDHLGDFAALKAGLEAAADRDDAPAAALAASAPVPPPPPAAAPAAAGADTCAKCGAKLAANQKFCPSCGTARA